MTQGIIRVPIPDAEELPKELKGKRLWMKDPHDDPKTAIERVRVIGKGLMLPEVLHEEANPPHLVFEYWVNLLTSVVHTTSAPCSPGCLNSWLSKHWPR